MKTYTDENKVRKSKKAHYLQKTMYPKKTNTVRDEKNCPVGE